MAFFNLHCNDVEGPVMVGGEGSDQGTLLTPALEQIARFVMRSQRGFSIYLMFLEKKLKLGN